jgi:hypothetical protein
LVCETPPPFPQEKLINLLNINPNGIRIELDFPLLFDSGDRIANRSLETSGQIISLTSDGPAVGWRILEEVEMFTQNITLGVQTTGYLRWVTPMTISRSNNNVTVNIRTSNLMADQPIIYPVSVIAIRSIANDGRPVVVVPPGLMPRQIGFEMVSVNNSSGSVWSPGLASVGTLANGILSIYPTLDTLANWAGSNAGVQGFTLNYTSR